MSIFNRHTYFYSIAVHDLEPGTSEVQPTPSYFVDGTFDFDGTAHEAYLFIKDRIQQRGDFVRFVAFNRV